MALSAHARDRAESALYDELQEAGELRGTIVAKHDDGTFDVAMASATRPPMALRVPPELLRPVGLEHRRMSAQHRGRREAGAVGRCAFLTVRRLRQALGLGG